MLEDSCERRCVVCLCVFLLFLLFQRQNYGVETIAKDVNIQELRCSKTSHANLHLVMTCHDLSKALQLPPKRIMYSGLRVDGTLTKRYFIWTPI